MVSINVVNEVSVSLRAVYHGCLMTNCDVINIRNIITSELAKVRYWIREIKRPPDTMKAATILVVLYGNLFNRNRTLKYTFSLLGGRLKLRRNLRTRC